MSALTKPLIYPTSTINGEGDSVNVELISTMTKVTTPANTLGAASVPKEQYWIVFAHAHADNSIRETVWKYDDETARDDAYDAVNTYAAQSIA